MHTARSLAVTCLLEMEQGGFSNLVVKQRTQNTTIDARDMQFFARLFYGTLERTVTLDYILAPLCSKPLSKLDAEVLAILRSGLYQCLYMDSVSIPTAVDESVKLCARFKKKSAAGLVNAILRKAANFNVAALGALKDPVERLSVQYSVCRELAEMLLEQYGEEAAPILEATLHQVAPVVRVNTLKTNSEALAARLAGTGIETQKTELPEALAITAGRYLESDALLDGAMRLQSFAAQYAVHILDPKPGGSMLDLCAAPGGKTLTAAQMMRNEGSIVALDLYESRINLINRQAEREGIAIVETQCADASTYKNAQLFDVVLCDVPCSGYGELAKKPELRRKAPTAPSLVPLQQVLLQNAAAHVKPGGRIVYATCTLDNRENAGIVDAFLMKNDEFKTAEPAYLPVCVRKVGQYVQFVPQEQHNEGFFIATLERMW